MGFSFSKESLQEIPNRREKIIFFVAMFVFIIGFMKSCWNPSTTSLRVVKSEIKTMQIDRKAISDIVSNMGGTSDLRQNFNMGKDEWAIYDKMARKVANAPDAMLIREFSSPALLKSLDLTGVDFESRKIEGGVVKQKWKVSVEGSFMDIGGYLENLETLPILLIVKKIHVESIGNERGHVSAEIEGVAYGWK